MCGKWLPHKPTPLSCWLINVSVNFLCLPEWWPQVDLCYRVMMMGTFWHICSLTVRLHELNMHLSKTSRVLSAPAAYYLVCGSQAPFLRRMLCQVPQGPVPSCPPTFGPKPLRYPADCRPDVFCNIKLLMLGPMPHEGINCRKDSYNKDNFIR